MSYEASFNGLTYVTSLSCKPNKLGHFGAKNLFYNSAIYFDKQ